MKAPQEANGHQHITQTLSSTISALMDAAIFHRTCHTLPTGAAQGTMSTMPLIAEPSSSSIATTVQKNFGVNPDTASAISTDYTTMTWPMSCRTTALPAASTSTDPTVALPKLSTAINTEPWDLLPPPRFPILLLTTCMFGACTTTCGPTSCRPMAPNMPQISYFPLSATQQVSISYDNPPGPTMAWKKLPIISFTNTEMPIWTFIAKYHNHLTLKCFQSL